MKAIKSNVNYNGIELEVYQLPDGQYHLSKTQVGLAIEKHDKSLRQWLEGNSSEALQYKDYDHRQVQIDGTQLTIHSVPLNMAAAYWTYWASKGNTMAQALVATSVVECLTRLCDLAFGVQRTEQQIQQQNIETLETNKMLFALAEQMSALNSQMATLTERTVKLDKLEKNGKRHNGCLNVLEQNTNQDEWLTTRQFLRKKGLQYVTFENKLARRAASFARSGKLVESLPSRNGQIIYAPEDISYLENALKSILDLD